MCSHNQWKKPRSITIRKKKTNKHLYIYSRINMATTKYFIRLFHRGLPSTSSWYKITIKKTQPQRYSTSTTTSILEKRWHFFLLLVEPKLVSCLVKSQSPAIFEWQNTREFEAVCTTSHLKRSSGYQRWNRRSQTWNEKAIIVQNLLSHWLI
jgi:hypothetical protein